MDYYYKYIKYKTKYLNMLKFIENNKDLKQYATSELTGGDLQFKNPKDIYNHILYLNYLYNLKKQAIKQKNKNKHKYKKSSKKNKY